MVSVCFKVIKVKKRCVCRLHKSDMQLVAVSILFLMKN